MYKFVADGYIIATGENFPNGIAITSEEYQQITEARNNLVRRDGYYYMLRNDTLTYDEFKIPTEETDEREDIVD